MKIVTYLPGLLLLVLNGPGLRAQSASAPSQDSAKKYVYKDGTGGPMDSVLLKGYEPDSSLVVPRSTIVKANFPVIDVHTHPSQCQIKTF